MLCLGRVKTGTEILQVCSLPLCIIGDVHVPQKQS